MLKKLAINYFYQVSKSFLTTWLPWKAAVDLRYLLQKHVKLNVLKGLDFVVLGRSILIQNNVTYILYPLAVINLASKLKLLHTCLDTFVHNVGPPKTNVPAARIYLERTWIPSLLPMEIMPVLIVELLAFLRSQDLASINDSFGSLVPEGADGSGLKAKLLE